MNNKTIESLYNGDYTCIEKPILENSKYAKTLSKCTSLQEELTHLVDKETFSLIDNVLDCMNELSDIGAEESFIEGFSLAISLLLEALSEQYFTPSPMYFPKVLTRLPSPFPLFTF